MHSDDDRQRLARALGLGGEVLEVERVSRAWSNHLYRVRTGEGEFAVKQLLNPWDDPLWREWLAEAVALESASIACGVNAPAIVRNPEGAVLTEVGGTTYRLHRWIDGAHPCPDAPVTAEIARAVGADLARTHSSGVTPSRTDVFPRADAATGRGWDDLVTELASVHEGWAARAAAVCDDVAQIVEWFDDWLAAPEPEVMSHGDVDPKNLVLDDEGRVWWVDWDVAAPWRPADELARTALSMSGTDRADVARAVIDGYRSVGAVVPTLTSRHLTLDLVIGLDWTARCLRRATGLEPCDEQRRREALQMAASELDDLPGRVALARNFGAWLTTPEPE